MFTTPHNLANVPTEVLEEEQIRRAIVRTDRNIVQAFYAIERMTRKNFVRKQKLDRLRARVAKAGPRINGGAA